MDHSDPLPRQVLPAVTGWSTYFDLYAPYTALILFLLTLASLVSASEAAFFSLSHDDRTRCRDSNQANEQQIALLLERPRRLLASLVIFNNILNISVVVIVTYLTWKSSQVAYQSIWALAGVVLTTTLAIVFFGEIIPKVYASQSNLAVARRTVFLAQTGLFLFRPFSVMLVSLSNQIDKRIQRRGYKLSVEELSHAVELTGGSSSPEEKEMLKGIVNFSSLTARQIMRPRHAISALADTLVLSELVAQINASGYSRVPIFHESLDQVEGILYIKDLLPHLQQEDSFDWQTLVRPAYFIPENKKIDDLLQDFQKRRVHIAVVVDEYGGTRGLITLEDIIEEIFGDINDEFDEETPDDYRRENEQTVVFEGKIPVSDMCRILGVDSTTFEAVQGESESLGGLLLELFNRLPRTGETISYGDFTFDVITADDKRIGEVRVTKGQPVSVNG